MPTSVAQHSAPVFRSTLNSCCAVGRIARLFGPGADFPVSREQDRPRVSHAGRKSDAPAQLGGNVSSIAVGICLPDEIAELESVVNPRSGCRDTESAHERSG